LTLYLYLKLKGLTTDRSVLFWGIFFTLFWVLMWAYVFTQLKEPLPPREILEKIHKVNTALAYSYLGALAMGSVSVGLAMSVLTSSSAVAYATRFTRLTPARYLVEDFLAGVAAVTAFALACVAMVVAVNYARFGILVIPENSVLLVLYLVLCGILLYWFSRCIALAMLALGKPRLPLLNMVPLILAFLNYATLWVDLENKVYALPLAPLLSLIVSAAAGIEPATGGWLNGNWLWMALARGEAPKPPCLLDAKLALLSTTVWASVFFVASLVLVRRARGVPVEELSTS
jgi:hypothetical protein